VLARGAGPSWVLDYRKDLAVVVEIQEVKYCPPVLPNFEIVPDPAQRWGPEGQEIFATFMAVMEQRPEAAR
jgi:hypothetical protein